MKRAIVLLLLVGCKNPDPLADNGNVTPENEHHVRKTQIVWASGDTVIVDTAYGQIDRLINGAYGYTTDGVHQTRVVGPLLMRAIQ